MSGERVFSEAIGPIRAVIVAEGSALALFSPKVQNTLVRLALNAGGRMWIEVFLPKRFSAYATRLGYRVSQRWSKFKSYHGDGTVVPFVGFTPPGGGPVAPGWKQRNGEKMIIAALQGANVKSTATLTKARLVFTIPYGHPVQADTSDTFRTVPTWEVARIAQVTAKHLQNAIDGLLPANAIANAPVPRLVAAPRTVRAVGLGSRAGAGGAGRRVG